MSRRGRWLGGLGLVLAAVLQLAACGGVAAQPPADSTASLGAAEQAAQTTIGTTPILVVATFSVLADIVHRVGGDRIQVATLVGPDGDAHTFEPAPSHARVLGDADAIFEIGLGFEPWLDELYSAGASQAARVVVTRGLVSSAPESQKASDGQIEVDPHVWHDVTLMIGVTERVRDGLVAVDRASADAYRDAAAAYVAELRELDRWVRERVATLPTDSRKLVTAHDTFSYFARQYGFEIVGVGLVTTEASDPSAAQVAELIAAVRAARVPAIFAENVSNPELMERIATEAGVVLVPDLYTDALGEPGMPGETYLSMVRFNVDRIVTALTPGA